MINRIIACVKLSIDPLADLQIADNRMVINESQLYAGCYISHVDRCVIEETVRLGRELNAETVALTVGSQKSFEVLKRCLAYGIDKAIHINIDDAEMNALSIAHLLSKKISTLDAELIICGQRSVDYGAGVIGQYLSEILGLPQLNNVRKIETDNEKKILVVSRQLEHGDRHVVKSALPAVVCVTDNINTPQYMSIKKYLNVSDKNIVKESVTASLSDSAEIQVVQQGWPKPRARKITMPDAAMSAAERMKFMMTGGLKKQQGNIYSGNVNGAVERIIQSLREENIL